MAGTSNSSGLNNLLADTKQVQTTLPGWMDSAQQNVANQANSAIAGAPSFNQTAAQGAVNTLQGANNPFNQAQSSLNTIASGAANPWITDPNTGAVTPNTNTAMGGLFAAQTDQLNQMMPTLTSGAEAGAIGSGNFGSLRGQTAVNTAKTNALSQLQAQQMQAALQNQQTGATAAGTLGNVGAQGITAGLTTGAAEMNAPFQGATNYANLINSINAPTTVSQQNQMSPLSMIGSLANAGGAGNTVLKNLGLSDSVLKKFGTSLSNLFGGSSYNSNGDLVDKNGNVVRGADDDTVKGWTTDSLGNTYNNGVATSLPPGYTIDEYGGLVGGTTDDDFTDDGYGYDFTDEE
jgi:hypothetical protein